ncbi:MAG: HAMP domain-containing histidine kinase [Bacteriovoracaceae bacterium]|nr:HAMP domain-containing histidine kinase [Bacteriovoracaceae bacterium]
MNIAQFFTPSNVQNKFNVEDFDLQDHLDKSNLLINFILIAIAAISAHMIKSMFDNFYTYMPIYYSLLPCLVINLFLYKWKGNYFFAAHFLLFSMTLTFFAFLLSSGGFKAMVIYWLPIIPGVTIFMLGTRWGIFWTSVNVVMHVFAGWAVHTSLVETALIPADIVATDCTTTIILGAIAYLSIPYLYFSRKENAVNKLNEKNRLFLKAVSDKQHLLAVLYHDITGPLTIIQGKARVKYDRITQLTPQNIDELKDRCKSIQNATANMFEIIEEVKNVESLELDSIALRPTLINFMPHLNAALKAVEEQYLIKEVAVKTQFSEVFSDAIFADPTSLQKNIFENILTNACKFSYRGSKIIIKGENIGEQTIVTFEDFGHGIESSRLPSILDNKVKTSTLGTEKERGIGIGLPIVKAYMDFYKGRIEIKSTSKKENQTGHGTLITLFFYNK